MARFTVNTDIKAPENITINLIREDFLNISNHYRVAFEVCLAVTATIGGNILSIANTNKAIPVLNWLFFGFTFIGSIAFVFLSYKSYEKAKSNTN